MDADRKTFAAAIRKKQSQWFSKGEKPSDSTKLGQVIRACQFVGRAKRSPKNIPYDPNFAAKIRKRQPNWFRE